MKKKKALTPTRPFMPFITATFLAFASCSNGPQEPVDSNLLLEVIQLRDSLEGIVLRQAEESKNKISKWVPEELTGYMLNRIPSDKEIIEREQDIFKLVESKQGLLKCFQEKQIDDWHITKFQVQFLKVKISRQVNNPDSVGVLSVENQWGGEKFADDSFDSLKNDRTNDEYVNCYDSYCKGWGSFERYMCDIGQPGINEAQKRFLAYLLFIIDNLEKL